MSDNYDAVYAAVRSRMGYADLGSLAERALYDVLGHIRGELITQEFCIAAAEHARPSAVFRPELTCPAAGSYIARYSGIIGVGKSPDEAMRDFDQNWTKKEK